MQMQQIKRKQNRWKKIVEREKSSTYRRIIWRKEIHNNIINYYNHLQDDYVYMYRTFYEWHTTDDYIFMSLLWWEEKLTLALTTY